MRKLTVYSKESSRLVSLDEEYSSFQRKMERNDKGNSKIKEELFGRVTIDEMPFELQEQFTRSSLNISPNDWDNLNLEIRGRTIAVEIIKSRLETLERFNAILERNKTSRRKNGKN